MGEQVEIVRSVARLAELEPQLWALFWRDPLATPFQSPAWTMAWLETLASRAELVAFVTFDSSEIAGFIPTVICPTSQGNVLRLVGHGESDYLGGLFEPGRASHSASDLSELLEALKDRDIHRVELGDLPSGSPVLMAATAHAAEVQVGETCPVVALRTTYEEQRDLLPRWLRRNLSQTERRLGRAGTPKWCAASSSSLEETLEAFFRLHTAYWRQRGQGGVLQRDEVRRFHRQSARALLEAGLLDLVTLRLSGRIVAVAHVLVHRSTALYLTGIDPELERLSLGSLLVAKTMQRAVLRGHTCYDFLRGSEPYKYQFGAHDTFTYRAELPRCNGAVSQ